VLADHQEPAAPVHQPPAPAEPRVVPITLDAVLRLAEAHNARIALARARLHESQLTTAQGALGWLPNTYAGIAYYRHEGGIQDFTGQLLHSSTGALYPGLQIQSELDLREGVFQLIDLERRVWQSKAELSQVNNEVLLEAVTTYIDLLAARRGEAIAAELEKYEQKLLDRAEKLAKTERGAAGLVESAKATLSGRQQLSARLKQQGNAASAKLVYLLGLPPGTCLQPVDLILAPVELVDSSPAVCDLVAQALANGPGVRELEGIVSLVQLAMEKTHGAHNLLPTVQLNVFEGPFGAGPGGSLAWDNRLDIGLGFRWNLTQLCQTEFKRSLIRTKQAQAMLNYEDLKGKLAAGVAESKDAILFGREQIGLAAGQIRHASESYRLADRRLEQGLRDVSPGDVLLAIRSLEQAHFNYLQAISGHNKAQVRLMMLLGGGPPPAPAHPAHPLPAPAPAVLPPPKAEEKPTPEKREPTALGDWRQAR
jgi:outer membrane protein TolC